MKLTSIKWIALITGKIFKNEANHLNTYFINSFGKPLEITTGHGKQFLRKKY